jgi:hypothetical protein
LKSVARHAEHGDREGESFWPILTHPEQLHTESTRVNTETTLANTESTLIHTESTLANTESTFFAPRSFTLAVSPRRRRLILTGFSSPRCRLRRCCEFIFFTLISSSSPLTYLLSCPPASSPFHLPSTMLSTSPLRVRLRPLPPLSFVLMPNASPSPFCLLHLHSRPRIIMPVFTNRCVHFSFAFISSADDSALLILSPSRLTAYLAFRPCSAPCSEDVGRDCRIDRTEFGLSNGDGAWMG